MLIVPPKKVPTGASLDQLRIDWIDVYENGGNYETKLPGLGIAIGQFIDNQAGTEPGPLTSEQRNAWILVYHRLGEELAHISESL